MAAVGDTKIEWATKVWNPVTGCTPVSRGCDNCYAERMHGRFRLIPFSQIVFHEDRLDQPLRWRKPQRVFVCSMGDLFHEDVSDETIQAVFGVMSSAGHHTFMILTKRADLMRDWMMKATLSECQAEFVIQVPVEKYRSPGGRTERVRQDTINGPWPLPHVGLGVSVEDQATADERIPILLQTPAAVRFVSVEPMLAEVNMTRYLHDSNCDYFRWNKTCRVCICCEPREVSVEWIIIGDESGPGRRISPPGAIKALKDQAVAANVPVFIKQAEINGRLVKMPELDGRVWDELPEEKDGSVRRPQSPRQRP